MSDSCTPKNVAVLVPMYRTTLTSAEAFSLRNTLKVLGRYDVFVIGPNKLEASLQQYKVEAKLDFAISLYGDKFFENIAGYNALMMSRHFYRSFAQYDYVLIVQTDALVFSDQLEQWCNRDYSYIGAPWLSSSENDDMQVRFVGVGNGGFSLRRVEDFIAFLSVPRHVENVTLSSYFAENPSLSDLARKYVHKLVFSYNFPPCQPRVSEDVFWGLLAPRCEVAFKVPVPEQAIAFAFEVAPERLYELNHQQLPFGCHAWERYSPGFWRTLLGEHGIELP